MLRLWLLRHAKSAWDDPALDDVARPLSPRGRKACRALARHMSERAICPDLVLCSPAKRARQTWERIEKRLASKTPPKVPGEPRLRFEPQLYLADRATLLKLVRAAPVWARELLLVGHNPGLEEFAVDLAGSSAGDALDRLRDKYPTGGLAELTFKAKTWSLVSGGAGSLVSFVTPAQLRGGSD